MVFKARSEGGGEQEQERIWRQCMWTNLSRIQAVKQQGESRVKTQRIFLRGVDAICCIISGHPHQPETTKFNTMTHLFLYQSADLPSPDPFSCASETQEVVVKENP